MAAVAAVAMSGVAAVPAHADITKTLTSQCDLPLVGSTPVSVVATLSNSANDPYDNSHLIQVAVTVSNSTGWSGALVNAAGAATIEGSPYPTLAPSTTPAYGVLVGAKALYPGGPPSGTGFSAPLTVAPTHLDATSPVTFVGKGITPPILTGGKGIANIAYGTLRLNLAVKEADGSPVQFNSTVYDANGQSIDSDGNPDTFDVDCGVPTSTGPIVVCLAVVFPPSAPANVTASSITALGATLTWGKSVPNMPGCSQADATGYDIYDGSTKIASVSGVNTTTTTIGGLTPNTTYTLSVRATNGSSGYEGTSDPTSVTFTTGTLDPGPTPTPTFTATPTSTPTATPTPPSTPTPTRTVDGTATPQQTPTPSSTPTPTVIVDNFFAPYAVKGSATLKNLVKGALPLTGTFVASLPQLQRNVVDAQLTLAPTTATLTALGFLPVTAKVNLIATQNVTGQLTNGKLTATAKVRVKLPSITVFGAQIAGGSSCQATQVSTIPLASTQPQFSAATGGPIAGSFSISNLAGCGALTGVISPLTAGSGNSILLNLTPAF